MAEVKCKICGGEHLAMGYCNRHYLQFKVHGKIYRRTKHDKNEIIDCGIYYEIVLYKGRGESTEVAKTKIDKNDLNKVKNYKWRLANKGNGKYKIVVTNIKLDSKKQKTLQLSHLIIGKPAHGCVVRHINDDGLDNRKQNLKFSAFRSCFKTGKDNPIRGKKQKLSKKTKLKMIEARSGSQHWNYKGGRKYHSSGYIQLLIHEHPFSNSYGYIFEHRYSTECILGRFLTPKERIHHIDENKANNLPENLFVFNSEREHRNYHHKAKDNTGILITKSNLYNFQYVK